MAEETSTNPAQWLIYGLLVTVLVGLATYCTSDHNDDSITPAPGIAAPKPRSGEGLYEPYKDTLPWKRPVAELGRSTELEPYVDRYWQWADYDAWDKPERRGHMWMTVGDYSTPIYDARQATSKRDFYVTNWGYGEDGSIPWSDKFAGGGGSDNALAILNPDTGELWGIWADQGANFSSCLGKVFVGFTPLSDMCVGGGGQLKNDDGSNADARSWEGTSINRGNGMPPISGFVTSWEVATGKISHAATVIVFNSMIGPACDAAQMNTAARGVDCGFYLPPAQRIEHNAGAHSACPAGRNQPTNAEWRSKTVPQGLRLALDITDEDIESWLDSRGYQDPLRSTARVFAVALRDYGWIVTDTGCSGVAMLVDGFKNPDSKKVWDSLGVTNDDISGSLLDGLITRDRMYAVNPSTPIATTAKVIPGRYPS